MDSLYQKLVSSFFVLYLLCKYFNNSMRMSIDKDVIIINCLILVIWVINGKFMS
jgi:hypothetical protein